MCYKIADEMLSAERCGGKRFHFFLAFGNGFALTRLSDYIVYILAMWCFFVFASIR